MKKYLSLLPALALVLFLASCGVKEAVQGATRDVLTGVTGIESSGGGSSAGSGESKSGGGLLGGLLGGIGGALGELTPDSYDEDVTLYIGGTDVWQPFPGESGVSFTLSDEELLAVSDNGIAIEFTGKQTGECIITATLNGKTIRLLVRIRAAEGGTTWTLRIDDATMMDMMGLAVVDYDIDLTATHIGPTMFGIYTGELGMVYDADLSGMQSLFAASGVDMSYSTDGWFKNTSFRMDLTAYNADDEQRFVDSLKDPNVTDAERELVNSYMGSMFDGVGSGEKPFETSNSPVGFWYDWALHMTEGDLSAYVNMNSAMFSASASQNATAQHADGYASAILVGSFQSSQSYADKSPFPYQIEVYESGEAVFTLRNPTESPIVVKFYGTITKS